MTSELDANGIVYPGIVDPVSMFVVGADKPLSCTVALEKAKIDGTVVDSLYSDGAASGSGLLLSCLTPPSRATVLFSACRLLTGKQLLVAWWC